MKDLGGFDVKKDTRIKGEEVTMLKKKTLRAPYYFLKLTFYFSLFTFPFIFHV